MTKKDDVDLMDDLISQAEAARLRNVTRASINELIKRGRLNSVTIAGRVFVRRSEVLKFRELKRGPRGDAR